MTTDESQLRHKVHLQCCWDRGGVPSRFIAVARATVPPSSRLIRFF
jgi:hypothetical protein